MPKKLKILSTVYSVIVRSLEKVLFQIDDDKSVIIISTSLDEEDRHAALLAAAARIIFGEIRSTTNKAYLLAWTDFFENNVNLLEWRVGKCATKPLPAAKLKTEKQDIGNDIKLIIRTGN